MFSYNENTGTITFSDIEENPLTHSEVRALLNNPLKEVRLFDENYDATLFDQSIGTGGGSADDWSFLSLGEDPKLGIVMYW